MFAYLPHRQSWTQSHCYFVSPRLEHIPLTRSSGHLLAPWSFNSVEPAASEQSTVPWDERGIAGPAFSRDRLFGAAESL